MGEKERQVGRQRERRERKRERERGGESWERKRGR